MERKRKQISEAVREFRLRKKLLSEATNHEDISHRSIEVHTNILLPTETEEVTDSIDERANLTSLQSDCEDITYVQGENLREVVQLVTPIIEIETNDLKATHDIDISHSSPDRKSVV